MQTDQTTRRPGSWALRGAILGAFVGLLLGKFALGLIFGGIAGIVTDARRRKPSAPDRDHPIA